MSVALSERCSYRSKSGCGASKTIGRRALRAEDGEQRVAPLHGACRDHDVRALDEAAPPRFDQRAAVVPVRMLPGTGRDVVPGFVQHLGVRPELRTVGILDQHAVASPPLLPVAHLDLVLRHDGTISPRRAQRYTGARGIRCGLLRSRCVAELRQPLGRRRGDAGLDAELLEVADGRPHLVDPPGRVRL